MVVDDRPSPIAARLPEPKQDEQASSLSVPPVAAPVKLADSTGEQERSRSDGSTNWAIIAATYNSFSAAQKRATNLKSSYGVCVCSVYPREGEGQKYYVLVGSSLTRAQADLRREQAVSAGLPGDTYVTKLVAADTSGNVSTGQQSGDSISTGDGR